MTSLAYIFTMEKVLVKIIFDHKIIICHTIFKIFVAPLKTFEMQKGDNNTFSWNVSEQDDMQIGSFQRML